MCGCCRKDGTFVPLTPHIKIDRNGNQTRVEHVLLTFNTRMAWESNKKERDATGSPALFYEERKERVVERLR